MPSTRILLRILTLTLALPVLWFFGPVQLHGHTGYVVVDGISMEQPHHKGLHGGDLVLLHEAGSYHKGEIVAYHSKKLGVVVLHRIVRVTRDGRYVFKGDNNDFVDPGPYPSANDLIGSKWGRVPQAGNVMLWVKDSLHAAIIGALAIILGLFSAGAAPRQRSEGAVAPSPPRWRTSQIQLIPAIALAFFVGLWLIALGTPHSKTALDSQLYQQTGRFSWSARTARSATYPDGVVRTRDAIFTHLVPKLSVAFAYKLQSEAVVKAQGTAQLELVVSGSNGWKTVRPLTPARTIDNTALNLTGVLDLAGLTRLAHAVDAETGVASDVYTVSVLPTVHLKGTADETPIDATFSPPLRFVFDTRSLALDTTDTDTPNTLTRSQPGAGVVNKANRFHLGPLVLGVERMRTVAGLLSALSLLALIAATIFVRARRDRDEPSRLAWEYGHLFVPITELPRTSSIVTDVTDFESLVRLAERYNRAIMHLEDRGEHGYLVKENGLLYRYVAYDAGLQRLLAKGHGVVGTA